MTGLSVKPATAMLAIATDEARSNELVLLRNLLVGEFLDMGILSKWRPSNMDEIRCVIQQQVTFLTTIRSDLTIGPSGSVRELTSSVTAERRSRRGY